jgi:hypothetical protein
MLSSFIITTLAAYVGWFLMVLGIAFWTDSYDKVATLLLLPLDPLFTSLEPLLKWFYNLFSPDLSWSYTLWALFLIGTTYVVTILNTLYWYSGEIMEVYRLLGLEPNWLVIFGFIPQALHYFCIAPGVDLIMAPIYSFLGTEIDLGSNAWINSWRMTFSAVIQVIQSDLLYLCTGITENNILDLEVSDVALGSVDSPILEESNPWDGDSDSSGSSTPRAYDRYFRSESPVGGAHLDPDHDPSFDGWVLVEPHPDSFKLRLTTLILSHSWIFSSVTISTGVVVAKWLLSSSTHIMG